MGIINAIKEFDQKLATTEHMLEEECKDGDRICKALGVERTEGGRLNIRAMLNAIAVLDPPKTYPKGTIQFCWLIEQQEHSIFYWQGAIDEGAHFWKWSVDPLQAVRFPTKEAAKTIITRLKLHYPYADGGGNVNNTVDAVEHGFIHERPTAATEGEK